MREISRIKYWLPTCLKRSRYTALVLQNYGNLQKGENRCEEAVQHGVVDIVYGSSMGVLGRKILKRKGKKRFVGGTFSYRQLGGKKLSTNNLAETFGSVDLASIATGKREFALFAKHCNPSGIGEAQTMYRAVQNANATSPYSNHGAVVVLGGDCDEATAELLVATGYKDVVATTGTFDEDALKVLKKAQKYKIKLLEVTEASPLPYRFKFVGNGFVTLPKKHYNRPLCTSELAVPTLKKPTLKQFKQCKSSWRYAGLMDSNGSGAVRAVVDEDSKITELALLAGGSDIKRSGSTHLTAWRMLDYEMLEEYNERNYMKHGINLIPKERFVKPGDDITFFTDASFFMPDAVEQFDPKIWLGYVSRMYGIDFAELYRNSGGTELPKLQFVQGGIAPTGSINDKKILEYYDENDMFCITGMDRFVKHGTA